MKFSTFAFEKILYSSDLIGGLLLLHACQDKHDEDTAPSHNWKTVCRKRKYKTKQIENAAR